MEAIHQLHQPTNKLYGYNVRVYGIDHPPLAEPFGTGNPNSVGDAVWVKPPGNRCHTRFDHGTVTKVISDLAAEVDGIRAISATCVMLHKDRLIVFLRMMSRKTRFSAMMITCWWMSRRHLHHYRGRTFRFGQQGHLACLISAQKKYPTSTTAKLLLTVNVKLSVVVIYMIRGECNRSISVLCYIVVLSRCGNR